MQISDSLRERFWSYVAKREGDGCWVWVGTKRRDGYGVIGLGARELGLIRAHRLSWLIQVGEIPVGAFLCHRCDNPSCVRVDHLFIGTAKENHYDMRAKRRHSDPPRMLGTSNVNAKLNPEKVRKIRRLRSEGAGYHQLAKRFRVYHGTIRKVCRGELWSHVV